MSFGVQNESFLVDALDKIASIEDKLERDRKKGSKKIHLTQFALKRREEANLMSKLYKEDEIMNCVDDPLA